MSKTVPFERLIASEPTNLAFGWQISTDGLQELLSTCEIKPEVPEDVRKQLEVAKKLFVYGYFVYEFYTLAGFVSILAVESALVHRFSDYYKMDFRLRKKTERMTAKSYEGLRLLLRKGWEFEDPPDFRCGFKSLLRWAAARTLIGKPLAFIESLPRIRGTFAHPLFQTVMPIAMAQPAIESMVELVNELFAQTSNSGTTSV
jgi:hypothetical protein